MTAEVITYRRRSAVRDVGKALGLPDDRVDALAKRIEHFRGKSDPRGEAGENADSSAPPFCSDAARLALTG